VRLDTLVNDLRAGARIVRTAPGLSLTIILLIALVVGGNTTIYSIVHALLSRPATGIVADRLFTLQNREDGRPTGPEHSYSDLEDLEAAGTFESVLGFIFVAFSATFEDGTDAIRGVSATQNYFATLGVPLARGRTFTDGESGLNASGLVAIISDRLWRERFAARNDILGQTLVVNGAAATIVGVTRPEFRGVMLGEMTDLWVPIVAFARATGRMESLTDRGARTVIVIGRLPGDATTQSAGRSLAAFSARLAQAYPDTNGRRSVTLVPYSLTAAGNSLFAERAPIFLALFSVLTAVTLLIVCANVANLMLARLVGRQRELAVRLSLGASRGTVLRLIFAESVVLAVLAWIAASGFSWWVSRGVVASLTPASGTGLLLVDVSPDSTVLAYALVLALAGAALFSVAPSMRVWRQNLLATLQPGEAGSSPLRSRVSRSLAIAQIAFCVLLLVAAGLAWRSLSLIAVSSLGFATDQLLLVRVNTAGTAQTPDAHIQALESVRSALLTRPGMVAVTYARTTPPYGATTEVLRTQADGRPLIARVNTVGPDYFSVLGAPTRAGRDFAADDARRPAGVVVNESLAGALWPGQSPLGRSVLVGRTLTPMRVEGIAPDAYFTGFMDASQPQALFLPEQQSRRGPGLVTFMIRYSGPTEQAAAAARLALKQIDDRLPIVSMTTMDAALDDARSPVRTVTTLLALFAAGSLLIAAIGLYGVVAFSMRQRGREFGVRIALGASRRQLIRGVLVEGLMLTAVGLGVGFLLSAGAANAGRNLLVGVTPTDPSTYLSVFALLAIVSLLASYLPARRVTRIDPVRALRQD
jgi:predicted permease